MTICESGNSSFGRTQKRTAEGRRDRRTYIKYKITSFLKEVCQIDEISILTLAYPGLQSSARKISISLSIHFALMMRSLGEHFGSTGHSIPGIQRDKTMNDKLVYIPNNGE